jgi:hypothetical protein
MDFPASQRDNQHTALNIKLVRQTGNLIDYSNLIQAKSLTTTSTTDESNTL